MTLHLQWQLVRSGPANRGFTVAATDRYVAITNTGPGAASQITLLDEQTGTQQTLSPPNCSQPSYSSLQFGGPWLMVGCTHATAALYNLEDGSWVAFTVSPQCPGGCIAVDIGRYWVKLKSLCGGNEHCAPSYYLQNISTQAVKPDPITPGGRIFDDLSAPSGSTQLCSPLRYPTYADYPGALPSLGALTFAGQFALANYWIGAGPGKPNTSGGYLLERCNSRLNVALGGLYARVLASSGMVLWYDFNGFPSLGSTVVWQGRFLPSLQRFTIVLPPQPDGIANLVALSLRTVYMSTATQTGTQLWAATLPVPGTSQAP